MNKDYISSVWNFDEDRKSDLYNTHNLLRWYGRLPYDLVDRLILQYSKPGDKILANFSGSGTIALEALRLGRNVTGTEINPAALLASRVKTESTRFNINKFLQEIGKKNTWPSHKAENDIEEKWFTSKSLSSIKEIKRLIDKNKGTKAEKDFLTLILLSITKKVSLVDSRCVNHIVLDKKKKEVDVVELFKRKLHSSFDSLKKVNSGFKKGVSVKILEVDARKTKLPNSEFDLVISHPPYLGNVDYTNINQLENYFLGSERADVRAQDISTNSLEKYLESMFAVIDEAYRVTRKDGYICIIIGDNRKNGELIPTFSYFIQHALKLELSLEDIFIWVLKNKAGRGIKRHGHHIDHNYILVFRK